MCVKLLYKYEEIADYNIKNIADDQLFLELRLQNNNFKEVA